MSSRGSFKRFHEGVGSELNKRQKQEGPICPEEAHACEVPSTGGKKKYYAIWGGPNPGVHYTIWDVARNWIERFSVKQRSFKDAGLASDYYQQQKMQFPDLDNIRRQSQNAPQTPKDLHPSRSLCAVVPDLNAESIPLQEKSAPLQWQLPSTPTRGCSAPLLPLQSLPPSRDPPLSHEQARLVDLIVNRRKNVFYTGSAGVGKSRALKAFRQHLSALGLKVNVLAPTGRAALEINGSTTWSYAGWTPDSMKKPLEELLRQAWKKMTKKRIQKTDVLVIDEISMVENFHLERLNAIMKEVRQNEKAFGGVQVVITGDFCQLPPVNPFRSCIVCGKDMVEISRKSAYECVHCNKIYNDEDKWAFQSKAWGEANFEHVNLETIFRQRDRAFIDILQNLRLGMRLSASDRALLCQRRPNLHKAVKLYPRKEDVKRINDEEFKKLRTEPRLYHSVDDFEQQHHHTMLQFYNDRVEDGTLRKLAEHRYEPHLELKKDMLVILLANISISEGLVNGSQGTIVGFTDCWAAEDEQRSQEQITADIENDLEGDYKGYRARRIFDFMANTSCKHWPIVRFYHRGQAREVIIKANCYPTELGDEPASNPQYSLLSRTQIPLMAAWAMTIHKSQGMTLEQVEVDLSRNFEEGMAYVALSRATTLEGLRVISFPESVEMRCNEEVRDFLEEKFKIADGIHDQT